MVVEASSLSPWAGRQVILMSCARAHLPFVQLLELSSLRARLHYSGLRSRRQWFAGRLALPLEQAGYWCRLLW